MNVLVLEDETDVAQVVDSYLRRDGFQTTLCSTVHDARASLRRSRPALMILDLGLPDGSGFDVLRESTATGARVPAIVLTARGDESDRVVGLELGADDYMIKPFSPRELMARVHAVLRRVAEETPVTSAGAQTQRIDAMEIDRASHEVRIEGNCRTHRDRVSDYIGACG